MAEMTRILPPTLVALLLLIAVPLGILLPGSMRIAWPWRLTGLIILIGGFQLAGTSHRLFERTGTTIGTFVEQEPHIADLVEISERLDRIANTSAADLTDADLDKQKEILELLDIQVMSNEDGYTINGTLPYWAGERGKMATQAPQRR